MKSPLSWFIKNFKKVPPTLTLVGTNAVSGVTEFTYGPSTYLVILVTKYGMVGPDKPYLYDIAIRHNKSVNSITRRVGFSPEEALRKYLKNIDIR